MNQNVNVTKRATFVKNFNLCLLQQYKWNTIKIRLLRLIINAPYESNFMTILGFFINRLKKLDVVESRGRCRWREEAVVERFKQEAIYELSTGTSFIDQACSVKMALYWPCSFMRFYWPRIRLGQWKRKKRMANIQPSWPNKLGP